MCVRTINDIAKSVSNKTCQLVLFADDTNVFLVGKDLRVLKVEAEKTLKELSMWFACNKLTLSLEKTQFNVFHMKNKSIPDCWNSIEVQGNSIKRVGEAKYLGVILDETLSWKAHIESLRKTLQKYASSFKIIKNQVPKQCKMQLFYAHIHSRIQYGIEVLRACK
jgi:hypothetical protein